MIYHLQFRKYIDDSISLVAIGRTKYKVKESWYPVSVSWGDDTIEDAIKAINKEHALKRANWNWETADRIELIK